MDYLYAQLDENELCVGLSQLAGAVEADHMVPLTEDEFVNGDLLGNRYRDGAWLDLEPEMEAAEGGDM